MCYDISVSKSPFKLPKKIQLGELFSGPGGIATGAFQAAEELGVGLGHAWAVDYDRDSCFTYARNVLKAEGDELPESVLNKSVTDVRFGILPEIHALAFGFPCNDFSMVGEKKGTSGDFGPLYSYGVKALKAHSPLFFVAENVGGLRSSKTASGGSALSMIIKELSEAGEGYEVYPHYYKFEDYGVPQTRHRVILVGIRKNVAEHVDYQIPAPTHLGRHVPVSSALDGIIAGDPRWKNNDFTKQSDVVVERLKCIKPGENAWNSTIKDPKLRLNVKNVRMSQIYRRLHPDQPSYTVTGSGGGGTHVYHWSEPRALTNRERAAIQTFPRSYAFHGSKESVRKQVGMAVPPKGAYVVFRSILMSLLAMPYRSIPSNMPDA
jgi:DNA (cytosine-5)-methyltransferase 1